MPCSWLSPRLLAWYDRHRRELPWRAPPGQPSDPYRVWLSEIMLQQTTVAATVAYFQRFVERWPDVHALADASLEEVLQLWQGLGYYARARNLHRCAQTVSRELGGRFPDNAAGLQALPGIGPYTAAAIAAIAFDEAIVPADGNVERVVSRLDAVEDPLPQAKPLLRDLAQDLVVADRPGDLAQALMDLGATVCTPRSPKCLLCPLTQGCAAYAGGEPATYPRKVPKKAAPRRFGHVYLLRNRQGHVLVRRRPPRGLLGGLVELPTTEWLLGTAPPHPEGAPLAADWRRIPGQVDWAFTHFPLTLTPWAATTPATTAPAGTWWASATELEGEALSSLMRKVLRHYDAAEE